ncbi:hypothetical protein LZP73_12510 [Shewanella sp. AS16]|uniref:hypothetical protein n=1 Tax=Shewanella sp. AS16 TaxID=2907625 RepID=UPI001F274C23|nr:hypothetical protein [Shewanella sp. AS16]MCE9687015.1 hypothetical protein [Shewanella sp. AS16]
MSEAIDKLLQSKPALKPIITELSARKLITVKGGRYQTTRRWHGAMMRAARYFAEQGETRQDMRLPITKALLECYGRQVSDTELCQAIGIMLVLS